MFTWKELYAIKKIYIIYKYSKLFSLEMSNNSHFNDCGKLFINRNMTRSRESNNVTFIFYF